MVVVLSLWSSWLQRLPLTTQLTIANCIVDLPLYIMASVLVGKIWCSVIRHSECLPQQVIRSQAEVADPRQGRA